MNTPDERILHLMAVLKTQNKIKSMHEFCDNVSIIRQTVYKIKKGKAGFTVQHINTICKKYKVNANWIFGLEPHVFLTPDSIKIT